jgi:hypothetical protein
MANLYKAIWLQVLFQRDGYKSQRRWLDDCHRSGFLHPSVFDVGRYAPSTSTLVQWSK